jgi:K(+)-stimulated pyrophosphate-energized sodium pump
MGEQVAALVIDKKLVVGLFLGSMLPYWFASIVLMAIGKGASNIANDVFRQYAEVGSSFASGT